MQDELKQAEKKSFAQSVGWSLISSMCLLGGLVLATKGSILLGGTIGVAGIVSGVKSLQEISKNISLEDRIVTENIAQRAAELTVKKIEQNRSSELGTEPKEESLSSSKWQTDIANQSAMSISGAKGR